jgi:hypothetical protein
VIQQLPRKGGIRDCFVARPNHLLFSVDWGGVELVTHAQSCLWIVGHSELANALNAGIKVHDALGATIAGVSYEEMLAREKGGFLDDIRQASKPPNFLYPGGGGAVTLVITYRSDGQGSTACPNGPVEIDKKGTRGYKGIRFCVLVDGAERCGEEMVTEWGYRAREIPPTCRHCIVVSEGLRDKWFIKWPENRPYLKYISGLNGEITQHVSDRVRGNLEYCQAANGYFQALAADAAKEALCRIAKECYTDRSSPLWGSRSILFQHDEFIGESPEDVAADAAERVSEIMVKTLQEFCPDLADAATAPPALMRRWYKGAEPVYSEGRLIPWVPN